MIEVKASMVEILRRHKENAFKSRILNSRKGSRKSSIGALKKGSRKRKSANRLKFVSTTQLGQVKQLMSLSKSQEPKFLRIKRSRPNKL